MAKPSAKRSERTKPNKQKAARVARGEKQALESLARKRSPFEKLLRAIVSGVVQAQQPRAPAPQPTADPLEPRTGATWVEVGSGLGQLRGLLPEWVLPHLIHTDISEWLIRGLLTRYPGARAQTASVQRLPFPDASVSAVLGLCAFDSFPDPLAAVTEILRVLRQGGRFIHFLDAATNIEPLLQHLVAAGRLPLPNFVADVALRRPDLVDTSAAKHLEPYRDVLSVPLEQFIRVLEVLRRSGHGMAPMLHRYSEVFARRPFEPLAAARAFVELTSSADAARPMNQALMSLLTTLQQPPYSSHLPFELTSHSSLAFFRGTLEHFFGAAFGFRVCLSDVVYARSFEADIRDPLRARVRRVGIGQNSVNWPEPHGTAVSELTEAAAEREPPHVSPETHLLREAAVYCFVAEKA